MHWRLREISLGDPGNARCFDLPEEEAPYAIFLGKNGDLQVERACRDALAWITVAKWGIKLDAVADNVAILPTNPRTSPGSGSSPSVEEYELGREDVLGQKREVIFLRESDQIRFSSTPHRLALEWDPTEIQVTSSTAMANEVPDTQTFSDENDDEDEEPEMNGANVDHDMIEISRSHSLQGGMHSTPFGSMARSEVVQETPTINRIEVHETTLRSQKSLFGAGPGATEHGLNGAAETEVFSTAPADSHSHGLNPTEADPINGDDVSNVENDPEEHSPSMSKEAIAAEEVEAVEPQIGMSDDQSDDMQSDSREEADTTANPDEEPKSAEDTDVTEDEEVDEPTPKPKDKEEATRREPSESPAPTSVARDTSKSKVHKRGTKRPTPADEDEDEDEGELSDVAPLHPFKRTRSVVSETQDSRMSNIDVDLDVDDAIDVKTPKPAPTKKGRGRPPGRKTTSPTMKNSTPSVGRSTTTPVPRVTATPASSGRARTSSQRSQKSATDGEPYKGPPPKVVFSNTNVDTRPTLMEFLKKQGGSDSKDSIEEENFNMLCVGNGELAKTAKLLMAIALGLPIVTEKWLADSAKAGRLLSTEAYLPHAPKQEEQWRFSMEAIQGKPQRDLLEGKTLYVTPAPKKDYAKGYDNIRRIAFAAGAEDVISKPARFLKDEYAEDTIILALGHDDTDCRALFDRDRTCYKKDLISNSILRGQVDFEDEAHQITMETTHKEKSMGEKPKKGRKR